MNLDIKLYCPYHLYSPQQPTFKSNHYTTVENGNVPPAFRNYGPNSAMPPVPRHGGLFSGPESNNPWNSIPVTPTMTNYIQNNLRSAHPPPGATEQYIGTNRLGNNYSSKPGVYWFNPTDHMEGKFKIQGTKECDQRSFTEQGSPIHFNRQTGVYEYTSQLLG